MLRDALEVALNDLIVALREAADAYDTAAQIIEAADCTALFSRARDDHCRQAERLEGEQRRLGHLPKEADAEAVLLQEAVSHAKASLADDELAALLAERQEQEKRVLVCADALLDLELSEDLHRAVTQVEEQAAEHLAALGGARPAVG